MKLQVMLLLVFLSAVSSIASFPMVSHETASPSKAPHLENGSPCNEVGEIYSEDPCKPWCICKDGAVVCAEIFCNDEVPKTCGKIKVNARCCPTFVCVHRNGTASMHYPLPMTVVPPSMYEDDPDLFRDTKRNLPHRGRTGGFL